MLYYKKNNEFVKKIKILIRKKTIEKQRVEKKKKYKIENVNVKLITPQILVHVLIVTQITLKTLLIINVF